MIMIYDRGKLVRMKSLGLQEDIKHLSGDELKSVEGIGFPTKYEQKGSAALNVFYRFIEGKVKVENIDSIFG